MALPEGEITAANAASLTGKLSQLANGAIYDDDDNIIEFHDRKSYVNTIDTPCTSENYSLIGE